MAAELTPFPDGIGYMEYGWDGHSPAQRRVLMWRAGYADEPVPFPRSTTWAILRSRGTIAPTSIDITDRGRALVEFARRTGRWPT
jgi:hypothetical protein